MQSLLLEVRYFAWGETVNFIAEQAFLICWLCTLFSRNQNKERAKLKYMNASKVLPEKLIVEIQKYVQGETLYIPKPETEYQKWGASSGGRRLLDRRNAAIRNSFINGSSIQQLANEYFLSTETIKKIVYSHKK
jgi:Mor family transcriptional regulator